MDIKFSCTQTAKQMQRQNVKHQNTSNSFDEHLNNARSFKTSYEWFSEKDNQILNEAMNNLNLSNDQKMEIDRHLWLASCAALYNQDFQEYERGGKVGEMPSFSAQRLKKQLAGKNDAISQIFSRLIEGKKHLDKNSYLTDFFNELNRLLKQNNKPIVELNIDPKK